MAIKQSLQPILASSFLEIDRLHIVGWQHAGLSCPVHRACHPALVYERRIDDDVAVPEADLVAVLALVVVHGLVAAHLLPDLARPLLGRPPALLGLAGCWLLAGRLLEGGGLGLAVSARVACLAAVLAVAIRRLLHVWLLMLLAVLGCWVRACALLLLRCLLSRLLLVHSLLAGLLLSLLLLRIL